MSPTVLREGPFRYFFFSREELRMHVHVSGEGGEAKFWLEPTIELAVSYRLSARQLQDIAKTVEEHKDDIISNWKRHFPAER